MKPPPFLILGASGLIGAYLTEYLGRQNTIATYCKRPFPGGVFFDAGKMRLKNTLLSGTHGLTHAFILNGITKIDACAHDPEGTARVNVQGICQVIDDLIEVGVVPIFTSSDAVFDGTQGLYTEKSLLNPILTYGRHKVMVEEHLIQVKAPWVIARLSKVVASDVNSHSMLGEWINNIDEKKPIKCAHDQIFSPAYILDVVEALAKLAKQGFTGLFHVGGTSPFSRLELLNLLIKKIQEYQPVDCEVIPCSIRDLPLLEPRPLNTSMSSRKLYFTLDMSFEGMETVCGRVAAQRYQKTVHGRVL